MITQRQKVMKQLTKGNVTVKQLVKKGMPEGTAWKVFSDLHLNVGLNKKKIKKGAFKYSAPDYAKAVFLKAI
jgi:hypothetical protein